MADNSIRDLTNGNPMKLVLSFMLPLLLGMLFQQFYNMVDTVVVGKFLGIEALAGVGSTGSITFLVLGLCNGICAGFAIPVAQKFGQRDYVGLRKFVGNMIWLSAVLALGITVVTVALCRSLLVWMRTPENTFQFAYDYVLLIFLGIPATMLYNLTSGIIRSMGDSKTPLYFLIFSSTLNVVLDIVCVFNLKMGVAGAGWATLVSQLTSGILCIAYMAKCFPILKLGWEDLRLEKHCVIRLLVIGLPMGMQYSITAIGSILLQTSVNTLGSTAMAAVTAGSKVAMFACCPFDAIGSTCATFAGQNIGAGKPERVHKGVQDMAAIGVVYALVSFLVLYFLGDNLARLFLNTGDTASMERILPMARKYLLSNAIFYVPLLYVNLLRFTIQGLGFSNLAVIAGVFEMVARGVFGICLVPWFGFYAVCFASPAAWVMADVFLYPAYWHCLKQKGFARCRKGAFHLKKLSI